MKANPKTLAIAAILTAMTLSTNVVYASGYGLPDNLLKALGGVSAKNAGKLNKTPKGAVERYKKARAATNNDEAFKLAGEGGIFYKEGNTIIVARTPKSTERSLELQIPDDSAMIAHVLQQTGKEAALKKELAKMTLSKQNIKVGDIETEHIIYKSAADAKGVHREIHWDAANGNLLSSEVKLPNDMYSFSVKRTEGENYSVSVKELNKQTVKTFKQVPGHLNVTSFTSINSATLRLHTLDNGVTADVIDVALKASKTERNGVQSATLVR